MKLSIFNNVVEISDGIVIYNTYSGGILRLDEEHTKTFVTGHWDDDEELKNALIKGNMLVDEQVDEIFRIQFQNRLASSSCDGLSLTIAPTLACNFRCPYCYEKGKKYTTMDDDTILALVQFIKNNIGPSKTLGIAWYGGEPLLRMDIIQKIIKELGDDSIKLQQIIVTNGYLLSEEIAKSLKDIGVQNAQVTVDGPPEIHNNSRIHADGRETFHAILQNIEKACEYLRINIRVNVNKETLSKAEQIFDYLDDYGLRGKVSLYLAPIDNTNGQCNSAICYNRIEFAQEEIGFLRKHIDRGYIGLGFGSYTPTICGATNINSYVIDPLGDLYKCWEEIGDVQYKVGDVFNGIVCGDALKRWTSYDFLSSDECKECKIFPVCRGGCPKRFLDNGKGERLCSTIKYNTGSLIELLNILKPRANGIAK